MNAIEIKSRRKRRLGLKYAMQPFRRFVAAESFGGILLLIFTAIAMVWANSGAAPLYKQMQDLPITFGVGSLSFIRPLHFWVNDGLMAVFFFVVGLEIKREIIAGELSSLRMSSLPVLAAAGGMIVPALIYFFFNSGSEAVSGWGIPTATDIAFALGVLSLLGNRVSTGLKVFLTALAIADDMGAVLVIAIFYSSGIALNWLLVSIFLLAFLFMLNKLNVFSVWAYVIPGIFLIVSVYNTGIHPTIAGVLTALTIPVRNKIGGETLEHIVGSYLQEFREAFREDKHPLENKKEQEGIKAIEKASRRARTPLKTLEDTLHPWVTYFIMPVFALVNAGVALSGNISGALSDSVTIGVIAGLVIGKPVGIVLFSFLAVKSGIADLPAGGSWKGMLGMGILAGIGFTMSIFITGLAFTNSILIDHAKIGILVASAIAGIAGYLFSRFSRISPVQNE